MREITFRWVCRNIHFNKIERVQLTDTMLINRTYPSWITSDNCEVIAKLIPSEVPDRNNREIYEGDKVRLLGEVFEVTYSTGMWYLEPVKGGDADFLTNYESQDLEVIGDKYS
jgi:hypothetical protein